MMGSRGYVLRRPLRCILAPVFAISLLLCFFLEILLNLTFYGMSFGNIFAMILNDGCVPWGLKFQVLKLYMIMVSISSMEFCGNLRIN